MKCQEKISCITQIASLPVRGAWIEMGKLHLN